MVHGITLHDTTTEEEIGTVICSEKDSLILEQEVRRTWELYHEHEEIFIWDFVLFHNENSNVKVTYLETEFIQL